MELHIKGGGDHSPPLLIRDQIHIRSAPSVGPFCVAESINMMASTNTRGDTARVLRSDCTSRLQIAREDCEAKLTTTFQEILKICSKERA